MNQSTEPLLSLDADYYTDATIFTAETKGLLARTWQFAGHASNVSEVGVCGTQQNVRIWIK